MGYKILNSDIFNRKHIINIFFIIILIHIKRVQTDVNTYFKTIYLSDNYYFIVTFENIYYYNPNLESLSTPYTFTSQQQFKIVEDSKMVNYGKFKYNTDVQNLLVVKNYLYSFIDGTYKCYQAISEIENYIAEVYPFKCNTYCYFCFWNLRYK